jgi:predicted MPP superfamily phosphohydrolase
MALAFVGFGMTERFSVRTATVLYETGQPWVIFFLYLLILFVVADLAALCHLLHKGLLRDSWTGLGTAVGIVALTLILGNIHYRHKYREELTIRTEKPLDKPLTIVMASDLHVGYHNRRAEIARWVDLINAEHPDLVLFGGDIVDIRLRPLLEGNYAGEFARIKAPLFAVPGNHEYIGGVEDAEKFYADAGIALLRDSVVRFGGITVIGRDDRSNPDRKPLALLSDRAEGFTILLDHQPFHLEEAEQAGIDFQFSGHTHRGQVWPLSWVTDAMYEKSWGDHRRGSTRYYVSSGLGIWGPKIRIGTRSEYLVLHVNASREP